MLTAPVSSLKLLALPVTIHNVNGEKTIELAKEAEGASAASQAYIIKHFYQSIENPNGKFQAPNIPIIHTDLRILATVPSAFEIGDVVKFLPQFVEIKALSYFPSVEPEEAIQKVMAAIGIVQAVSEQVVIVQFKGLDDKFWSCFSSILVKLNHYSINQLIKIRSDTPTVQKLKGSVGRVIGIDGRDPSGKVFIRFDDPEIHQWLPTDVPLPSAWMDSFQSAHPAIDRELLELFSLESSLFFKAVSEGDLRTAKLLYNRQLGVDAEARNSGGRTALHVASRKGHTDLVEWLLNEAKVDVNKSDVKGYRAIHHAVLGCNLKVLEILLSRGANVNSQTDCGKTALHMVVIRKLTDFLVPLKEYNADANLQDSEGNTPLHVAIWSEDYRLLDEVMRIFSFEWDLPNKKGFNAFHLAVIKNSLKAVEFITVKESMMCGLLDVMPFRRSTVLHYACIHKNYPLAKLLVDESKNWITPDNLPLLEKLLEARDESGMTALLIASQVQDYAIVELLVEAGADVNATDKHGNTAIILAASSQDENSSIPSKERSPTIYRIYEDALKDTEAAKELMMQSLPILSLISYLVANGAILVGKKDVDLLIKKGSPESVIEMITRMASKVPVRDPSGGSNNCMHPPVHLVSCPHKPAYKACHQCFLLYFSQMKCGCPEEDIEPISSDDPLELSDLSWIKEEDSSLEHVEIEPDILSYDTSWFQDGAIDEEEGTSTIHPQLPYVDPDVLKRKLDDGEKRMEGQSSSKKGHRSKAD